MKNKHVEEVQIKDGIFIYPNECYTLPDEKREWAGKWIWAPQSIYGEFQESSYTLFEKHSWNFAVFYFKKAWYLNKKPDSAKLFITADCSYELFINDAFVGRGSAKPGGDYANCDPVPYKFYESYEVQENLHQGDNTILVKVCLGPVVLSDISSGHGGLIAELQMMDNTHEANIHTDESWLCTREEAYERSDLWDGLYCLDKNLAQPWYNAEEVDEKSVFPELLATSVPNLTYVTIFPENIINPFDSQGRITCHKERGEIRIKAGAPITFWVDFNILYAAYPQMNIYGGTGTKITLHMQEFPGKTERDGATEVYLLGEGINRISSLRMHSIHYIQVSISNIYEEVRITDLNINVSVYPSDMQGEFHCDNPMYEKIYQIGCRTNQICRQTYHMDSPLHQEPLGCMGDYMIESLMNYYTFGDQWLTRFDILKISYYMKSRNYRMFHPSYCLLYIQMIYEYSMYTGDILILPKLKETVIGIMERFRGYLGKSGLIEHAPNYMFMDWVAEGKYNRHHPPKCMGQGYMTAMFAGALDSACNIFELYGDVEYIAEYRRLGNEIRCAVRCKLWDEKKELYVDGIYDKNANQSTEWFPADIPGKFYSQHMNTLAILYDIAPEHEQKKLMVRVMEEQSLSKAQPYFMHFVLNALAKTGLFEKYGLQQIGRWDALVKENESGLKEVWNGFDCDYSHAWGGTPTYQLPARILGVTPAKPGFSNIYFQPCLPKELNWADGKVPTPYGTIHVWLKRAEDGSVETSIKHPDEIQIEKGKCI